QRRGCRRWRRSWRHRTAWHRQPPATSGLLGRPLRSGLLSGALLRGALLRRGLLGAALARLLRRAPLPPLRQQGGGALEGEGVDRVLLAEGRVVLAVGDVVAEPTGLHHDRLPGDRVGAELLERRRGGGTAPGLRLRVDPLRLLEGDGEELV